MSDQAPSRLPLGYEGYHFLGPQRHGKYQEGCVRSYDIMVRFVEPHCSTE